jgi:hypothetical protein
MNKLLKSVLGFALMAVFGAAAMAATPDPYTILDRSIAATGGWAKLDSVKTIHMKGTLVIEGAGLSGTIESWSELPDKSRQEFDIKVLKQVSGDNGKVAWRVDQNGKLQIARDTASLKERKLAALMAVRENMKRGSKVFSVTFDRMDTADGSTCYVIKTTNTINTFVFYDYYDTSSYLPIKDVVIKPEGTTETTNRDFREVDGIKIPFEVHQLELPTQQRTTITFSSAEINVPVAESLFQPPSSQVRDFHFPEGKSLVEVPFKFMELHIYLPLTINGKTRLWVLDSGAGMTVVESDFAKELGLKTEGQLTGQGATTTVDVAFTVLPPFELNGLAFDSQRVAAISINELFHKSMGLDIGGILGYDFLSRLVTKVDYANEMLTFFDPDSFSYGGDGVVLDAPLAQNNMFQLQIAVDSQYTGSWDLDLGASGLDFLYPYAESHNLLNHPGVERMSFGAGGGQITKMAKFNTVKFAGWTVPNLQVGIPSAKGKGAFSRGEMTGNAGNDLFRHFDLYLDYAREKVIVEKGANFATVFPTDHSGLQLLLNDSNQVTVLMAAPGTPAEKAGFLKDDQVVKIDGKSPEELGGIMKIREILKGPVGTNIKFDLLRDGKPATATITLKDLYS